MCILLYLSKFKVCVWREVPAFRVSFWEVKAGFPWPLAGAISHLSPPAKEVSAPGCFQLSHSVFFELQLASPPLPLASVYPPGSGPRKAPLPPCFRVPEAPGYARFLFISTGEPT